MLCQEEFHPFQILFIPGIYCHLLDQELLSFPLLSSPINQIYYFMFIFFLFTSIMIYFYLYFLSIFIVFSSSFPGSYVSYVSYWFSSLLSFVWIGGQFPQDNFLSYGRILTLYYYFLLICISFISSL